LLAEMRDDDELREFSSSSDSWEGLCGRAGIALVREGKIIASILTTLS
jgi:hypothetical protein